MEPEPTIDPEDEGVDAYCFGLPRTSCPYPPWRYQRYEWLRGWDWAKDADEEDEDESAW